MPTATSHITCTIGNIEFNCIVDWRYNPGEKMVRYYADGSGYPGSPPEFDCVESVDIAECEYMHGDIDDDDNWAYADSNDRPDAFAIAARWIRADIDAGMYHDDLFDNAEANDWE
jgi:hypothetical protein